MLTEYALDGKAKFDDEHHQFSIDDGCRYDGIYRLSSERESKSESSLPYMVQPYRIGHPLAQSIINRNIGAQLPSKEIKFDYSGTEGKVALLEKLVRQSGWMKVMKMSIDSFEQEDHLLISCYTASGAKVYPEIAERMLTLPAKEIGDFVVEESIAKQLDGGITELKNGIVSESANRNQVFFEEEMDKLDSWASDMKVSLEREITDLDAEIKLKKSEAKKMTLLKDKVAAQRVIKDLEKKRAEKRQNLYQAQDEVDDKKEELLTKVEKMLEQKIEMTELFTIRWRVI